MFAVCSSQTWHDVIQSPRNAITFLTRSLVLFLSVSLSISSSCSFPLLLAFSKSLSPSIFLSPLFLAARTLISYRSFSLTTKTRPSLETEQRETSGTKSCSRLCANSCSILIMSERGNLRTSTRKHVSFPWIIEISVVTSVSKFSLESNHLKELLFN